MRIVLIGPVFPFRGGIAHYTTMFYRALRERKHEVLLVSFKRQYPQWLFPGRSDKDPSKKPLKIEKARFWIDSLNPITWLMTFWRIHRYRPDAIILQWWTTFWALVWFVLGVLNRLFLRGPTVIICHNVLPHETRWWDPLLTKAVLRWGTRFIVQSSEEENRLTTLIPGALVVVVPHPVYDMFADEQVPREEARRELGLALDVPVLLFFGIVREYKGLQDILAALPEVRARLGRVILLVAGVAYLGASLLDDPRLLWLADQSLAQVEAEGGYLYAQPGLEAPVTFEDIPPTGASCLLYGNLGLPNQVGPLAPDKIVFRDGWSSDSAYVMLNLRFTGWHRYKATNTITLLCIRVGHSSWSTRWANHSPGCRRAAVSSVTSGFRARI